MTPKNHLGMGVMIGIRNAATVDAVKGALGKTITSAALDTRPKAPGGGAVVLHFTDGTGLELWDDGQSCCESRYMTTDDDLSRLAGETLTDITLTDGPDLNKGTEDSGGWPADPHDTQFLNIHTNLGRVQVVTHNEHNGYYGGFWIVARILRSVGE